MLEYLFPNSYLRAISINKMSYSARIIADWFLARGAEEGEYFTQMKLQKLVYIAHGWTLALADKPLINEKIEAWQWGPVIRELYVDFVNYGASPIYLVPDKPPLLPDDSDLLEEVWGVYKIFTAGELSAMTHAPNTPWSDTYTPNQKRTIRQSLIKQHYLELKASNA